MKSSSFCETQIFQWNIITKRIIEIMTRVCVIADRYVILFLSFFDQSLVFLLHVRITDIMGVIHYYWNIVFFVQKRLHSLFFFV